MDAVAPTLESESSFSQAESPLDEADANVPCKGCGEILEEGKAFELAGNRWHIDCFRCNTCSTLLDSDANLLLLGDGSLICNNCTYSCNACGNKIEDLAILTGDQAFCATCFRCRNCKKKIENLKYARTSQGIFCMSCHESLMARRRKRVKSSKTSAPTSATGTGPILDKSLPALPSSHAPHRNDRSEPSPERSPASAWLPKSKLSPVSMLQGYDSLPASAARFDDQKSLLNAAAMRRRGSVSSLDPSDGDNDDDQRGFLPMAIDTSLVPGHSPIGTTRQPNAGVHTPDSKDVSGPIQNKEKEYSVQQAPASNKRDRYRPDDSASLRGGSPPAAEVDDTVPTAAKTHVAFQTKSKRRSTSAGNTPVDLTTSPKSAADRGPAADSRPDGFQLKEAPRSRTRNESIRKNATSTSPKVKRPEANIARPVTPLHEFDNIAPRNGQESPDSGGINPFDDPKLLDSTRSIIRREVPAQPLDSNPPSMHERSPSSVSITNSISAQPVYPIRTHSKPQDSSSPIPLRSNIVEAPQRSAGRSAPSKSVANDDFIAPRRPPAPPPLHERRNLSITSLQSDGLVSPIRSQFSRTSLSNDYTLDEDSARRIADGRKDSTGGETGASIMRRVSNAMRHHRSASDRAINQPHRKTSSVGQLEISGPFSTSGSVSPNLRSDGAISAELRAAQKRIAVLEGEKAALEDKVSSATSMKNFNFELRERRSTMAHLDTQREMAVRELEVFTEHLVRAKDSSQPFDIASLKNDILQDLSTSLRRLKEQLAPSIEDLVRRRNELTDEITNLIQVKDKGLQEFESLSSKNNQLNSLNAQLAQNIQESYKTQRGPASSHSTNLLNGLGIHNASNRSQDMQSTATGTSADSRPTLVSRGSNDSPVSHVSGTGDTPELGEAHATHLVNIRKGGQAKRFNWKKGSGDVAKKMTKGLKGAFARENEMVNGVPYASQPYSSTTTGDNPSVKPIKISDPIQAAPGSLAFFHHKNGGIKSDTTLSAVRNPSMSNLVVHEPSVLFGSELVARCEFENRLIPAVVTRCIQEVEARGMDVEGIYRKSGGKGQVQKIQAGFDRDAGYDISDPDLDIHAVTSCLKQYLRKLPNPLITFEAYDGILYSGEAPDNKKLVAMRNAVSALPQAHRDVLEFLLQHLVRVVAQQAVNLMTTLNISVVFAPTIMRPLSVEREMTDMMAQRETVRALLDNVSDIFD